MTVEWIKKLPPKRYLRGNWYGLILHVTVLKDATNARILDLFEYNTLKKLILY